MTTSDGGARGGEGGGSDLKTFDAGKSSNMRRL